MGTSVRSARRMSRAARFPPPLGTLHAVWQPGPSASVLRLDATGELADSLGAGKPDADYLGRDDQWPEYRRTDLQPCAIFARNLLDEFPGYRPGRDPRFLLSPGGLLESGNTRHYRHLDLLPRPRTIYQPTSPGSPAAGNPLSETVTKPTVTIGGVPANVTFSGLAPGFVGLYQVNAQVPASAPGRTFCSRRRFDGRSRLKPGHDCRAVSGIATVRGSMHVLASTA